MTAGRKPTRSNRKNNSQSNKSQKKISSRDKGKYIDYKEKRKKGDPLPSFVCFINISAELLRCTILPT